ncbi:hypothetical protein FSP39_013440 [Pinctada imbricata]|uniref:Uncharacterized protein n=1 Tax=Pinctada imbricata TaxID=66713 RepID=A0AA89C1I7_PINIB|nr:hypothetical protein FSP39_013440 [Pinctada imbricata]
MCNINNHIFSGLLPTKVLRLFKSINLLSISVDTYLKHQMSYLHPAISKEWSRFQQKYFAEMRRQQMSLVLGGDGRSDSPGHCAKYGSYAVLDLRVMLVVEVQVVQSNEVKGSCHMEKEGLRRCVDTITSHDLSIETLVTDRHVQIGKWVRENMPDTVHNYDVWHVAKGVKKKLISLAREKDCHEIQDWIQSISNHLYWSAASSQDGNGQLILQKWQSVANHVMNIHEHRGDLFPECAHETLEGRERQKPWLKPGSKVADKFEEIVFSMQLEKDIPKLSPGAQTSALEGFHSVINHFAPKMYHFSYQGMQSRILLAAMHYIENGMREQATTKDGKKRYNIVFPKFKHGKHTTREVKVPVSYEYVKRLMFRVQYLASTHNLAEGVKQSNIKPAPLPLASLYDRPEKSVAIQSFQSRFNSVEPESLCMSPQDMDTCS